MVSVVVIGRIGVCRIALGMSGEYAHEALVTGQFEIGVNMLCGEIETQEVVFVERPGLIGDCRREGDKSYGHDAVGYVGIESEVEAFFALDIFLLEKCRGPCVAGKTVESNMGEVVKCARTVVHRGIIYEIFAVLHGVDTYCVETGLVD